MCGCAHEACARRVPGRGPRGGGRQPGKAKGGGVGGRPARAGKHNSVGVGGWEASWKQAPIARAERCFRCLNLLMNPRSMCMVVGRIRQLLPRSGVLVRDACRVRVTTLVTSSSSTDGGSRKQVIRACIRVFRFGHKFSALRYSRKCAWTVPQLPRVAKNFSRASFQNSFKPLFHNCFHTTRTSPSTCRDPRATWRARLLRHPPRRSTPGFDCA